MRTSKIIRITFMLTALVVLGMIALNAWKNGPREELQGQETGSEPLHRSKPVVESVIQKSDRVFLEQLSQTHPKEIFEGQESAARVEYLTHSFKRMHAMSDYFNGQRLQREEIRELIADPSNVDMAKSILLNLAKTNEEYGAEQALARVYALKMLEEVARQGDLKTLTEVTVALAQQLNSVISDGHKIQQGREYDLEELLRISVSHAQLSELVQSEGLSAFLYDLGFDERMSPQLIRFYDNAVFFPLLKQYGREQASAMVAQAMNN